MDASLGVMSVSCDLRCWVVGLAVSRLICSSSSKFLCLAAGLNLHFKVEHYVSIRNRFTGGTRA
jgi:hypothetical protein